MLLGLAAFYRHFVLRGAGNYGLKISNAVTVAIGCDATVLVDADYANVSSYTSNSIVYSIQYPLIIIV